MSEFFTSINSILEAMLFFDILFGLVEGTTIPFLVAWLIIGGVYLTFKMNFVGFKYFKHAYL